MNVSGVLYADWYAYIARPAVDDMDNRPWNTEDDVDDAYDDEDHHDRMRFFSVFRFPHLIISL